MADLDIKVQIDILSDQYPWALNVTLEQLGYVVGADVKHTLSAIDSKGKVNEKLKDITETFIKNSNAVDNRIWNFNIHIDNVKSFMGSTDPLKGTVALIEDFAPVVFGMAGRVLPVLGVAGPGARIVNTTMKALTATTGAVAGAFYVYADVITEHVKSIRVMTDYGLIAGDLGLYTDMRESFGRVGMSLNEGLNAYKGYMPLFVNLKGQMTSNILAMSNFAGALGQTLDFGVKSSYVADKLNIEASILRKYLKIESLNQESQKLLLSRYSESSTRHLVMAELLGVTVDNWESDRQEAHDNMDFQFAIVKRTDYLEEKFGKGVIENITTFNGQTFSLFKNVLGPSFADDVRSTLRDTVFGVEYGATAVSSISEEFNTTLQLIGPDIRTAVLDMIDMGARGQLKGVDLDVMLQQIIKQISDVDIDGLVTAQGPIAEVREIVARAKTTAESYLNASRDHLEALTNAVIDNVEFADDPVDTVDNMRIAMRKVYNTLTPGFGKTQTSLKLFTDALDWMMEVFDNNDLTVGNSPYSKHFGIKDTRNLTTEDKRLALRKYNASNAASDLKLMTMAREQKISSSLNYDNFETQSTTAVNDQKVIAPEIKPVEINTGNASYTSNLGDELISKDRGIQYQTIGHGAGYVEPVEAIDFEIMMHQLNLSEITLQESQTLLNQIEIIDQQLELMDKPRKQGFAPYRSAGGNK